MGWFDAVAARHAHRLNAFTELAVTKLDVLGAYDEIPFAVAYELDGRRTTDMPPTQLLDLSRLPGDDVLRVRPPAVSRPVAEVAGPHRVHHGIRRLYHARAR